MVGTWTYTHATNLLTVTGGTSGAPAGFVDAWNADKAGTEEVEHLRTITGTDANPVVTAHTLRPTDYVELGGACNDLYITVSLWTNMTDATIHIVGADRCANAVSEDVFVNMNGSYNLVNKYASITSTQVTIYNSSGGGSSFKYMLVQGQWGVVWKQATNQYALDCRILVGDGGTSTYFTDTNKEVLFNSGVFTSTNYDYNIYMRVAGAATITFGVLEDAVMKTTSNGCTLLSLDTIYGHCIVGCGWGGNGTINLYNTTVDTLNTVKTVYVGRDYKIGNIYNCIFNHVSIYRFVADISNLRFTKCVGDIGVPLLIPNAGTTMTSIQVDGCTSNALYSSGSSCTYSDVTIRSAAGLSTLGGAVHNDYVINCVSNVWTFTWFSACTFYRQYTFDLKVTDKDNTPINAATVTVKDKFGAVVFTVNTAADGTIAQQTVSRGYYNQANGNTLQEYSPHNLTVTKAGYITYDQDFTLDEVTDWEIVLHTQLAGTADVGDVVLGETFYSDDADTPLTGTYIIPVLTGNANPSDVVLGKTFYKDDATNKLTGTFIIPTTGGGGYIASVPSPAKDILITATGHLLLNLNRNKPIYLEIE